ncbi:MAG: STT3 domain-containing protein, partial [Candidatus Omnitrophota bacterium]
MKKQNLRKIIPWFICAFITLIIGLHFRLYPLWHNVAADGYESGTMLVLAKMRADLTDQITRRFPEMPPARQQQLIQEQFNQILRTQKTKLRDTFDKVGLEIIKKTGEKRHYLQESDSYYFLDLTQNILEKGDVSTQVNGSLYFNNRMLAPLGYWEPQTWHPYIGAWIYKIAKAIDPDIDVMRGVAYTPLILFPFVLGAFFMACRAFGCQWPATFIASIFFVLAPIYLQRSTYAWYDNDSYSVLFPLLNLGFTALAIKSLDNPRKTILWSILAGLSFAFFARFWTGWSFSWGIIMVALTLIAIRAYIYKEHCRCNLALTVLMTGIATLICLIIMIGLTQFLALFPLATTELVKFITPGLKGWP